MRRSNAPALAKTTPAVGEEHLRHSPPQRLAGLPASSASVKLVLHEAFVIRSFMQEKLFININC